jgi:hypothetical protein
MPSIPTVQSTLSPLGHAQGKATPDGEGWVVVGSSPVGLKIEFNKDTVDGAALYVVPEDARLLIEQTFWEVTTGFTGGTSSAIGLSASTAPHDTKGDLLGGASGDVAATLVPGFAEGTPGASWSGAPGIVVLEAGTVIRFNRVASAFTAGAGFVHIIGRFIH